LDGKGLEFSFEFDFDFELVNGVFLATSQDRSHPGTSLVHLLIFPILFYYREPVGFWQCFSLSIFWSLFPPKFGVFNAREWLPFYSA